MSVDALIPHVIASIAIIIGISYVAGAGLRRLNQPPVVGQILAGIVLGPSVLGRLPGDLEAILLPAPVIPYLSVVAQIALVLFLLAVGYELDLRVLRRQRRAIPIISATAFVVPMLLGGGSVFVFGSLYLPGAGPPRDGFVLYMAVAMSITAVPVLASIIAERGMTRSRPGVVAMTSAGIIDMAAWLALLVVLLVGGASPGDDRSLPVAVALFAGYLLVMCYGVRPLLRRWSGRPGASLGRDIPVIVTVGMASAWATSALGLHVIFGAFLAGLIMPRTPLGTSDERLFRPLQETGNLLLPIFFVVAGLPVDIGRLTAPDFLLLGIICVTAIVGKFGGGFLGARLGGLPSREATIVGVLLNTRGLTELIVLTIGLQAGVIDRRLYSILVIMALVTTVLAGPLLDLLRFRRPPTPSTALNQPRLPARRSPSRIHCAQNGLDLRRSPSRIPHDQKARPETELAPKE